MNKLCKYHFTKERGEDCISFIEAPKGDTFPRSIDRCNWYFDGKLIPNINSNYYEPKMFIFKDDAFDIRISAVFEVRKLIAHKFTLYLWGFSIEDSNVYKHGLDNFEDILSISMRILGPNSITVVRRGVRTMFTNKLFQRGS